MMYKVGYGWIVLVLCASLVRGAEPDVRYFEENGVRYRETRRIERVPVAEMKWVAREETVASRPAAPANVAPQPISTSPPPANTDGKSGLAWTAPRLNASAPLAPVAPQGSATGGPARWVPVTQYRWEPRWHGRFNPFREPHLAYHMIPVTHWEYRTVPPVGVAPATGGGTAANAPRPLPPTMAATTARIPFQTAGPNAGSANVSSPNVSLSPAPVGEKKLVHVPQRVLRFEEREVVERVAVDLPRPTLPSEVPSAQVVNRNSAGSSVGSRPAPIRGMPSSGAPLWSWR